MLRVSICLLLAVLVCSWRWRTNAEPLVVSEDGAVAGAWLRADGQKERVKFTFGLPKIPAVKRWREGSALRGLWLTNGIRYTQTVLITTNDLARSGGGTTNSDPKVILLVNIEGENTNSEYTEASAELTLESAGRRQLLELKDGFIWHSVPDSALVGALEIPESGIKVTRGETLRFSGNMPPSLKGAMTVKIPLALSKGVTTPEWLSDIDVDYELRRSLTSRDQPLAKASRLIFADER